MPKEILFCLEDLCFGGTQRQTLELAKRLDRQKFSPSMLMLTGPTDLDELAFKEKIKLHYLNNTRRVHPLFFVKLGCTLRRLKPDLIIPCTALPNIWARIWGHLLKIPVIGTCRGGGGPFRQHERFLWKYTKHMICNSQALVDVLGGLGVVKEHLTYIPNGVDTAYFKPTPPPPSERAPIILCVARLCSDKDHVTLFQAFEKVYLKFPAARLLIVGDGPDEAKLKSWAKQHPNLPIEFQPGTTDVRSYYAAAKIFALSSIREGQPNVILEAMSAGLPICATSVGGIPHLIDHDRTGILSAPKDIKALADNLLAIFSDPQKADDYGDSARIIAQTKFSFSTMVEMHQNLFSLVLNQ